MLEVPYGLPFRAEKKFISHPDGQRLEYEVFGDSPTSLFIAGLHGDERTMIGRLRSRLSRAMVKYPDILSNIARVFQPNPEAIKAGIRGEDEIDLERQFKTKPDGKITYPRAQLLVNLLNQFPDLEYVFSFHEDTYHKAPYGAELKFYMYDIPPTDHEEDQSTITTLSRQLIKRIIEIFGEGIALTGIDDEELQIYVDNGYAMTPTTKYAIGDFEGYTVETGKRGNSKIKRAFIFEIPTNLPVDQKDRMVELIIDEFIAPFLESKS